MEVYALDWLNLLLRWLHLIAGAAWIGASFYFVMLDSSLKPATKEEDIKRGVHGNYWAVHGGGFYQSQKYLTGPKGEPLSEDLHWSKWEAYTTWLSGMGLLAIIYWFGASTYLIDKNVMTLEPAPAVAISIGFIAGGWLAYDLLCRLLAGKENLLAGLVFVLVMLADWALFQIFGARAAYVHVGAMMGTMMVANVFFHIIPGQKKMVDAIRAGQSVDPTPGVIGKQRSVHNTYFTLPVLFIMISSHYPMTYSHPHGWAVLGAIMIAGVLIRQFFVSRRRGRTLPVLLVIPALMLGGLFVFLAPKTAVTRSSGVSFAEAKAVIDRRCVSCHAATPTQEGFAQPPKGVMLHDAANISQQAAKVAETVANRYMPIGNLTQMTDDERALIAAWFAQGAKTR
jgi:uncharacterized membrane protein